MRTLATLVFIAVCGAAAVHLFQRPTVAAGPVMAADLLGQLRARGITQVTCDDRIPIGVAGATFHCRVAATDGSTAQIRYRMGRDGQLSGEVVEGTGATAGRVPASSDPWGN